MQSKKCTTESNDRLKRQTKYILYWGTFKVDIIQRFEWYDGISVFLYTPRNYFYSIQRGSPKFVRHAPYAGREERIHTSFCEWIAYVCVQFQ